jgi:hypothetical protein
MKQFILKYKWLSLGVGFLIVGIGPVFVMEALRKLGFDTVGPGLAWGLTLGVFFTLLGIVCIFVAATQPRK